MIIHDPRKAVPLGLCAIALTAASAAAQTTFHVVSYTNANPAPIGMTEGSPGLFYLATGSRPAILSVTTEGTETVLTSFPGGHEQMLGTVVSGPNGRFYDAVGVGVNPANVFSVSPAAGSRQVYSPQSLSPLLTQNLPDGTLLGTALPDSGGTWYVATVDLKGCRYAHLSVPSRGRGAHRHLRERRQLLWPRGKWAGLSLPRDSIGCPDEISELPQRRVAAKFLYATASGQRRQSLRGY
jgi:hypothetical protein